MAGLGRPARGHAGTWASHAQYSRYPDGLDRIYNLVKSPAIGINFDTGNAYLCGHDIYAWLERVAERLVHLHARISRWRGRVQTTKRDCLTDRGALHSALSTCARYRSNY